MKCKFWQLKKTGNGGSEIEASIALQRRISKELRRGHFKYAKRLVKRSRVRGFNVGLFVL